jgi:hypothetical protein
VIEVSPRLTSENEMPTYRVKTNIGKDGKEYVPGDTITLTEEESAAMPWAVESMETQKHEPVGAMITTTQDGPAVVLDCLKKESYFVPESPRDYAEAPIAMETPLLSDQEVSQLTPAPAPVSVKIEESAFKKKKK